MNIMHINKCTLQYKCPYFLAIKLDKLIRERTSWQSFCESFNDNMYKGFMVMNHDDEDDIFFGDR